MEGLPPLKVDESALKLFQKYSGRSLTESDVLVKAEHIRSKGAEFRAYRCIQEGWFLNPRVSTHPYYSELVKKFDNKNLTYLDLGCAFGTDIRTLISDGVSPSQLYASDITDHFWNLGLELFEDQGQRKDQLNSHFLIANVLESDFPEKIKQLGLPSFDIVYLGSVLHLFSEEQTKIAVDNCIKILNKNGILFGRCAGRTTPGVEMSSNHKDLRYLHSPETLKSLLDSCGLAETYAKVGENTPESLDRKSSHILMSFYGVKS